MPSYRGAWQFLCCKFIATKKKKSYMLPGFACSAVFAVLTACGADENVRDPDSAKLDVRHQAQTLLDSWPKVKGGRLPANAEVAFFISNLEATLPVLRRAIRDPDVRTAMRAAYVIEKIGPDARSLKDDLLDALTPESDVLVRIYVYGALRGIKARSDDVLDVLRAVRQHAIDDEMATDESIHASAALFVLSKDPAEKVACEEFVCRWLAPPTQKVEADELEKYWELRWSAVTAVQHMRGSLRAVPLLKAMLREPAAKEWVATKVPDALFALNCD
jgi:hypothetical protein